MKAININSKKRLLSLMALMVLSLTQVACDNAVFSNLGLQKSSDDGGGGGGGVTPAAAEDLIFIDDSFERDDIFADLVNNVIYGWRGFVLDGATPVIGFQSNGAGSSIPAVGALGPAAEGERFLLMNGRDNGAAVETLQIISQSYDLSEYNTAIISFQYLTFGLNDADDTTPEVLQLQVCRGTLNSCGANDDVLDPVGLQSAQWVTVFSSDNTVNDDALNGKNHAVSDWRQALVAIDLNNESFVGDSSTFVMRFVSVMKDGFKPGVAGEPGTGGECCNGDGQSTCQHKHKCKHACHKHKSGCKNGNNGNHYGWCKHKDHRNHDKHEGPCGKTCQSGQSSCSHTSTAVKTSAVSKVVTRAVSSSNNGGCSKNRGNHYGWCKHKDHRNHDKHECGCVTPPPPPPPPTCNCNADCDGGTPGTPADGTLLDGVAIDNVIGRATALFIDEVF